MRLGLSQNLRIEQRLVQSPQMIQAMQVLQYPLLELKDRIDQELEENVFLDVNEDGPTESAQGENGIPEARGATEAPGDAADANWDDPTLTATFETLDQLEKRSLELGSRIRRGTGEEDAKFEAMQNTPGPGESLAEHLIAQIILLELDEAERDHAELVVYSLDTDGRLVSTAEELAEEAQCAVEEIEEAIRVVQGLDPTGVGARNLTECLLLQIDALDGAHELSRLLVLHHLENLSLNRLPRIARETSASIEEVKEAVEFMRSHLHPHPGSQFGSVRNQTIAPDVVVEEIDGRFEVRIEKGGVPDLRISTVYRRLLAESKPDPKVKEYLRKKIESAKWFIDAIQQRQTTIQRIASRIVERQAEFLRRGVRFLKPMRMQDIADEVGVHISTVSRAISGKYVQTPQGIFDMKRFFSAGTKSDTGEILSQQAVKLKLEEIVSGEDGNCPFSDDAIVRELERDGIHIARRTVTKYRKSLGIPSSSQRKVY